MTAHARQFLMAAIAAWLPCFACADDNLLIGLWANYQYLPDDEANKNAWGEIGGEALIIYVDGETDEDERNWAYSAEVRFGPGSFTDPENNSTGDQFAIHKAWVAWGLNDSNQIVVGKSQVPFGWKTINFWPGDILLAGYGDQMDVGLKLSGELGLMEYDTAFYLADDWGSTSTDTVDDNRHWGSSTTYRKVRTWVGDLSVNFIDDHALGVSLQTGKLQDLTGTAGRPVDGSHRAGVLYYMGSVGDWFAKASYIDTHRELPEAYRAQTGLPKTIENQRFALELGFKREPWSFYVDATTARPDTDGTEADTISAFAPGFSYNYGPGWIYVEYLNQNGFIDRDGMILEGDFDAFYLSIDFYL
ncbi:hypothetical protein F6455_08265 [Proteobacteria bacterium 005FR1]|nr:hypothetical protein [Proteobacteria bacterium 005FR1]